MAVCERHGIYTKGEELCGQCWREGVRSKQIDKKSAPGKKTQIKSLADKAQSVFSKLVKLTYCKGKSHTNCATCGKPVLVKGTNIVNTAHAGHYYPKSIYWQLAYELENAMPQCYKCNTITQGVIPAMRTKLVEYWGEEKINALDLKADQFNVKVKTGQLKSRPDEIWLMAMIQKLNNDLKTKASS